MPDEHKLHRKLAEVMAEAERIPKNGVAPSSMGGFPFVQVGDAADAIRKALAARGVSMLPAQVEVVGETEHPTSSGKIMTTLTVRHTWVLTDGDTGEQATIQSLGSGGDTGDKAAPKAQTNSMKYALLMGFLLSTGDDPEGTDTSDRQGSGAAAAAPERAAGTGPSRGEAEAFLGVLTKSGTIRAGGAIGYKLERREGPEGAVFGFRLELLEPDPEGNKKSIPQVLVPPKVAIPLLAAVGGDPAALEGQSVTVKGQLFNVAVKGRASYYRLVVSTWDDGEHKIAPDAGT